MLKRVLSALAFAALAFPALAQNNFPTTGGQTVSGTVPMCLNASSQAVPCTDATATALRVNITSGGSGGGPVTSIDGGLVTLGTTTDAACATDNGTCTAEALSKRIAQRLTSLITALGTPLQGGGNIGTVATVTTVAAVTAITNALPAGAAIIGKVGIDQTTPGTTNAVSLAQIGATTTATGNGVVGTGVQRVAIASDNTAFAVTASLNATPSIANGNGVIIAPSSSATAGITPVVCGSAVSSCVLKASAGNLYGVYAECSAACWLMVFNATAAPTNGATTSGVASGNMVHCIPIIAGGAGSVSVNGNPPDVFTVGMTAAISSTTCATLTLATTGFINGKVQ